MGYTRAYAGRLEVVLIRTERLALREYTHDDWPTVLAYQSNPRYLRYYPWSERDGPTVRDWIAELKVCG
jgi:RimJ/RimL family protein N-acetyltransferase